MANDILGGIINPKYQAETMLVFVYPTRNIPQLSNLAEIPLV